MSTVKPDVVQDLVVQLISGDAEVVNALLEAFGPPIQRRLRRRYHGVLPPGEIEDVVLFAVEKLWFRRERFDPSPTEIAPDVEALRAALDRLPSDQRHILVADANGPGTTASSAALAAELRITASGVRSRRQHALARPRRELPQPDSRPVHWQA